MNKPCCLDGVQGEQAGEFDCSMRELECCLKTERDATVEEAVGGGANLRSGALAALFESDYQERFHSWLGASGMQYVCIVFEVGEEATIGQFPDLAVIGVARDSDQRRAMCLRQSSDFQPADIHDLRETAATLGVNEWHIHFAADYRKFCDDFAASRPNTGPGRDHLVRGQ